MFIIKEKISFSDIVSKDGEEFFPDDNMIKAVADIDQRIIAVNASLHSDLEELLLNSGSKQSSLYGFNIYGGGEIEYDSLINPPRNRDDGYPRGGRDVCDPEKRQLIKEIVEEWVSG